MSDQDNTFPKKPDEHANPSVNPNQETDGSILGNTELTYVPGIKIIPHDELYKNKGSTELNKTSESKENLNMKQSKEKNKKPKRKLSEILRDHKQKRYLKAKNSKWSKFNRYVFNSLNQKKKLRNEWIIIGVISLVLIAFFGTLLGIMQRFIGLGQPDYPSVYNARDLNAAMRIISIFCLAFLVVPYFYVMAAFFSGINQIHKSKTVHFIIWFTMIVDLLLLIVCCGMLIAGYYGLDGYNLSRNLV